MEPGNLNPAAVDTFVGGGLELSFERDLNGQVIAFYLSNTRTRGVRFEPVS